MTSSKQEIVLLEQVSALQQAEKTITEHSVLNYIHAATSANTRRAYQADIRHFIQCGGLLPASSDCIIRYLEQQAMRLNPRTLVRKLTSLKNWHLSQGFVDPTASLGVRKTMKGIRHVHGKPKNKALPLTLAVLLKWVDYLKSSSRLIDIRNNALLQIGFFGAFRRSELVAIQWEHIRWLPEGIEILIPRSKTDQAGEGQFCAIPYGNKALCAVNALQVWREHSPDQNGFVFKQIGKEGYIKTETIKPNQVNIIIKTIAKACNMQDIYLYRSHSMRRGFATEASKKGASFSAIMRQGRWQHEATVLGYIEEGKRFDNNAVSHLFNI
ncbi:MAG: hypothetical protein BGO43_05065 [Gammaproteobacteria bacterium 39-13]|nr:tyrosine-type recombinase/integrase [Gammaproteobacteria bacterium]OJV96221.1 MAG: hypothetical protein BGO43_05065 [Gammaproteobacteria bacterium 39-13]